MKYLFLISVITGLLYSCSPPDYVKSSPNIPLFDSAKQLNTSFKFGSLVELQGSYSITNNLGVFGGMNLGVLFPEFNKNYFEGGLSFTNQSPKDYINLCIGISFGERQYSSKYGLYPLYNIVDLDFKYNSIFIQPSVGFVSMIKKRRKNTLTLRIDRLHYANYKNIKYEHDESGDESYEYFTDIDDKNATAIRTGIFFTTQKSKDGFDSILQIGYSFPLKYSFNEKYIDLPENKGFFFKVGVNIPINFSK
jgi:hypothetical protein